MHAQVLRERVHHLLRLVQAQQAMVDEHAGEPVADRAVDERGRHGRIDAARQAQQDFVLADLLPDPCDGLGDVVVHVPVVAAAADVVREAGEDRRALLRVRHLGMELHRVEAARFVGHRGDRAGIATSR